MQYQRLAIAALVATLVLDACGGSKGPGGPQALSVDVAAAKRPEHLDELFARRTNRAARTVDARVPTERPIIEITVNIGDVANKGTLLARIDPSTLSAQLSQAQAQAAQQHASAQGAVVGLPVQTQANHAALETAKASLDNAKLVYDQNKQLSNKATFRKRRSNNRKRRTCRRSRRITTRSSACATTS